MIELRLPRGTLTLDRPVVMGIINVTPDSFSDGGQFLETKRAIDHGVALAAEGARIIDVGGESTRPGASAVDVDEELRRVLPVVEALAERDIVVSIDTRHAAVADRAVRCGASIINDVSGLRDADMRRVAALHGVPVVIMHMPVADPATMQQHAQYVDVVAEVVAFLAAQVAAARADGVDQIIVDPGIGFGKSAAHSVELIRRLDEIVTLGHPVIVGASRKAFIGRITGEPRPDARLAGTLAAHLASLDRGARIVRAHDVRSHVQAIAMWNALNP